MLKNSPKSVLHVKTLLSFIFMLTLSSLSFGQSTIWSENFNAAPTTNYTLSNTTSSSFVRNAAGGVTGGCAIITETGFGGGGNRRYDGSVITGTPTLTFTAGKYYKIVAYAKVTTSTGVLQFIKSLTNTNAGMKLETGSNIILNPTSTYNVGSSTYTRFEGTFTVGVTETLRYVGFHLFGDGVGNGATMSVDDLSIQESDTPFYCGTATSSSATYYINGFQTVGNITNMSNTGTGYTNSGYTDYTGLATTTQIPGGGITAKYTLSLSTSIKVWVDWNKDGTFNDATERVYDTGGYLGASTSFGFVVPTGTAAGDYRLRIRCYYSGLGSITPCGNLSNGETEDYKLTVVPDCAAKITGVTDASRCGNGSVTLSATATAGTTEWRWYTAETGGTLAGTSATSSWTTPSLSTTTTYWVAAWNGSCESYFRKRVVATIKPVSTLTFTTASPTVCGEDSIIALDASGSNEEVDLVNENFEGVAVLATSSTTSTGHEWTTQTSTFIPTGTALWRPAINSREAGNKFAYTTCNMPAENVVTRLVSNNLNSSTFTSLTLTFRHYFSYYASPGDHGYVQYSINGGTSWTDLFHYQSDQGEAGQFTTVSVGLPTACLNITNLRIRFSYESTGGNGWAVDDIRLYGTRPLVPNFTWTGSPVDAFTDAACTIPYTTGTPLAGTTVWVKPTLTQLETGSYSFTANANLTNGCTTSATINVTNKSKVWKGTINSDWNTASNWLPVGVPTANDCVIIPTGTTSQIMNTPNALAKNLKVKGTGTLNLQSGRNLTVTDWVNVESGATFNVRNSANLVQVTPLPSPANSGDIKMERTALIDSKDYVYWSSPVAGFNSANISTFSSNVHLYKWIPTIGGNGAGNYGNWANGTETMVLGKGYIERGLNSAPLNSPVNFTSTFTGVPNNGDITTPISRGTYDLADYSTLATSGSTTVATKDDDNWNLLGNPYPSSISAADFLNTNSTNLDGFVQIWTHGIAPSTSALDPFYNNYGYNYNPNDYITWNLSGPSTPGFSGYIGSGQGFMAKMKHTSPTASTTAIFRNSMRNASHTNSEFYKSANNQRATNINEGHIWIDLVSSSASTRSLIAYVNGATNERDQMYDAQADLKSNFRINSLLGYERLIIQGKTAPFNQNDQVNLAFSCPTNGTYNIAIGAVDGLFTDQSQNIYLEDKQLNIIHDLRSAPYQFTATQGENAARFVLRYTNQTLSNDTFDYNSTVSVYANENINIKSSLESIKEVRVYDVVGKTLLSKDRVAKNEIILNELKPTSGLVIVKVTLSNGNEVTKKVLF